jgi:hypothetical protein
MGGAVVDRVSSRVLLAWSEVCAPPALSQVAWEA